MGSNKYFVLLALVVIGFSQANAQNFDEWFRQKKTQIKYLEQQIAALQVYDQLLQEGYGTLQGGLQVIGDLKQGDFDLHHDYFLSLKKVNSNISKDGKTQRARTVYRDILQVCKQVLHQSQTLPSTERDYVQLVVSRLQINAQQVFHQYTLLTRGDHYQLTDDERMRQINASLYELTNQYAFIEHFDHQLAILRTQESHEQSGISALQQLYNP